MLLDLFHKILCFIGLHHMHDLGEAGGVFKGPPGLEVEGEYCCRCHKLNITKVKLGDKEQKSPKVIRM